MRHFFSARFNFSFSLSIFFLFNASAVGTCRLLGWLMAIRMLTNIGYWWNYLLSFNSQIACLVNLKRKKHFRKPPVKFKSGVSQSISFIKKKSSHHTSLFFFPHPSTPCMSNPILTVEGCAKSDLKVPSLRFFVDAEKQASLSVNWMVTMLSLMMTFLIFVT